MKKFFYLLLFFFLLLAFFSLNGKKVNATESGTTISDVLGRTVNVVKCSQIDEKAINSTLDIIDSNELSSWSRYERPMASGREEIVSTTNAFQFQKDSSLNCLKEAGIEIPEACLEVTREVSRNVVNSSFNLTKGWFFSYRYLYETRSSTLANSTTTNISNSLSSSYITELELIKNKSGYAKKQAFNDFFNKYGTHVVTSAIYGGKVCSIYSGYSTTESMSLELSDRLSSSLSAIYNGVCFKSQDNLQAYYNFFSEKSLNEKNHSLIL